MSLSYIKRAEQGNRSALSFIATILLCIGGLIIGQTVPIYFAIYLKKSANGEHISQGDLDTIGHIMGHFPSHISLPLVMMGFVFLLLMTLFGVRYIHRRNTRTLWSEQEKFRWLDFLKGAGITLLLMGIAHGSILLFSPGEYKWVFDPVKFYPFMVVVLIFVPLQTLSEEMFFRGYLYQGFGTAFNYFNRERNASINSKWVSFLLTGICFGAFHFNNPEMGINLWKVAVVYIGSGLMIGLSVLLTGGIEYGWGYHLVNNLFAFLFVTFPGSASDGPTLYLTTTPSANYLLTEFLISFLIFVTFLCILYPKKIKTLFNREA
jgi:uncharacterized protein